MPRILHFGVGNFHRAHQAWYTHAANSFDGSSVWTITGVSLRSAGVRDALASQNFNYSLITKDSEDSSYERISVIDNILLGTEEQQTILDLIADQETHIITVTVSEKGYYIDSSSNRLKLDDPVIANELAVNTPSSILGYLAFGLAQRQAAGAAPITIISCDNLSANSRSLKAAVIEFANAAALNNVASYIGQSTQFPDTMVDRITPATTQALKQEAREHHAREKSDFSDSCPVSTEPFSEWIIENRFATSIPAWDKAGAQYVDDVMPYELRKLRLLNGAHSYLAYAGHLRGHQYVHQAIADPELREVVDGLMNEAITTLSPEIQKQAPEYCKALIDRFSNSSLNHALIQIASDGSQKLPIRLLSMIKDRRKQGLEATCGRIAVVSWLKFVESQLSCGKTLQDPLSPMLEEVLQTQSENNVLQKELLSLIEPDDGTVAYCLSY